MFMEHEVVGSVWLFLCCFMLPAPCTGSPRGLKSEVVSHCGKLRAKTYPRAYLPLSTKWCVSSCAPCLCACFCMTRCHTGSQLMTFIAVSHVSRTQQPFFFLSDPHPNSKKRSTSTTLSSLRLAPLPPSRLPNE